MIWRILPPWGEEKYTISEYRTCRPSLQGKWSPACEHHCKTRNRFRRCFSIKAILKWAKIPFTQIMRIDDSLAKSLCKRFLREANERNEAHLERLSRASTHRKKAALYKLLPTAKDAFLFSFLGGSNTYPFMALMRLQYLY